MKLISGSTMRRAGRFAYRTTGTFTSVVGEIVIGGEFGGPYGAVGGALIGSGFWAGEKAYDGNMYWATQMSIFITNFNNGLTGVRYQGGNYDLEASF